MIVSFYTEVIKGAWSPYFMLISRLYDVAIVNFIRTLRSDQHHQIVKQAENQSNHLMDCSHKNYDCHGQTQIVVHSWELFFRKNSHPNHSQVEQRNVQRQQDLAYSELVFLPGRENRQQKEHCVDSQKQRHVPDDGSKRDQRIAHAVDEPVQLLFLSLFPFSLLFGCFVEENERETSCKGRKDEKKVLTRQVDFLGKTALVTALSDDGQVEVKHVHDRHVLSHDGHSVIDVLQVLFEEIAFGQGSWEKVKEGQNAVRKEQNGEAFDVGVEQVRWEAEKVAVVSWELLFDVGVDRGVQPDSSEERLVDADVNVGEDFSEVRREDDAWNEVHWADGPEVDEAHEEKGEREELEERNGGRGGRSDESEGLRSGWTNGGFIIVDGLMRRQIEAICWIRRLIFLGIVCRIGSICRVDWISRVCCIGIVRGVRGVCGVRGVRGVRGICIICIVYVGIICIVYVGIVGIIDVGIVRVIDVGIVRVIHSIRRIVVIDVRIVGITDVSTVGITDVSIVGIHILTKPTRS